MVWLQTALVATVFSATGETVLLDFYTDTCAPCRAMVGTIDALVEKGYPVRKINAGHDPQMARRYGVTQVPCYVMLLDGQEIDRYVGGTTYSRLEQMFDLAAARKAQQPSPPPATQTAPARPRPLLAVASSQDTPTAKAATAQPVPLPVASAAEPVVPDWTPRNPPEPDPDAALTTASVRLRVEDASGHSCGSGTIIDARRGAALILTCGHIFRNYHEGDRIEVDLFGPDGVRQAEGKLVSYNLDFGPDVIRGDVGLVSVAVPGPVAVARVAPPGTKVAPGDAVISVGCNNGDRPTARHSRVTSLDKFIGPPTVQVAGLPVEGRSGGGLFSSTGQVIGVCNAADPADQEGLYAALASIYAELDCKRLSFVYNGAEPQIAPLPETRTPPETLLAEAPPPLPKQMPRPVDPPPLSQAAPLSVEEQAALEEIRQRLRDGAQVVCVVTPREPGARAEVIILDTASPDFVGQLAGMARTPDPIRSTSLEIPRKERPEIKWAGETSQWRVSEDDPTVRR